MSKAFTREDDRADLPMWPAPMALLPAGARNYLTPDGHDRLRSELSRLLDEERPVLVEGSLTDVELRGELAQLDRRIQTLERSLANAVVVPPADPSGNQVRFGSRVTVRDRQGKMSTWRIVGVDEADLGRNAVSWQAPVAGALLNARLGERVPFKYPSGATELEILKIE